jgi:hypothetical protein
MTRLAKPIFITGAASGFVCAAANRRVAEDATDMALDINTDGLRKSATTASLQMVLSITRLIGPGPIKVKQHSAGCCSAGRFIRCRGGISHAVVIYYALRAFA